MKDIPRVKPTPAVLVLKRAEDIIVGAAGLLFFVISYPVVALAIKLDSRGGILYRQQRIGVNERDFDGNDGPVLAEDDKFHRPHFRSHDVGGKPFNIYKFRTMRTDAEAGGPRLAGIGHDNRVTRVGRWLRLLHIDELPQFWNVVRGQMSFIGPRPERPCFTEEYIKKIPYYSTRTLFLKPGLTGLSQIILGYDEGLESVVRKSQFDLSYAASFASLSSWLKMESWIIAGTVVYLLQRAFPRQEARVHATLEKIKSLPFTIRTQGVKHAVPATAFIQFHSQNDRAVLLRSSHPSELNERMKHLDLTGNVTVEVDVKTNGSLDMEDLVYILQLSRRVNRVGGKLHVRNSSVQVSQMMKEMHLENVMVMEPERSAVRNFLSFDVECWFHAHNLQAKIPKSVWHLCHSKVAQDVNIILDLLAAYKTTATFFVLGWVADSFPEVVQRIDAAGHEIGTHGYYHNLAYEMTPAEFEDDLIKSLTAISRWTKQPIISHRASNFSIIESSLWALEVLERNGIINDSSIFPVARHRYGIPNYPNRHPHRIHLKNGGTINEFPLSTVRLWNRNLPIAGGGYFRLYPQWFTTRFIEQMNGQGVPVMTYFHPWEVDPIQNKVDVGYPQRFLHYVNLNLTEWKLYRLLEKFNFNSIRENSTVPAVQKLLEEKPVFMQDQPAEERQRRYLAYLRAGSKLVTA